MYVSAALAICQPFVIIATENPDFREHFDNRLEFFVISQAIFVPISVVLWLWMAWANGHGRHWARIVACVLFGFATVATEISLTDNLYSLSEKVLSASSWVLGVAILVQLWRRQSSAYFRRDHAAPAS